MRSSSVHSRSTTHTGRLCSGRIASTMLPSLGGAMRCDAVHGSAISKPVGYTRSGHMQTPEPIGYRDVPGLSVRGDDQRDLLAVGAELRGHGRDLGDHLLDVPAQRRAAVGARVEGLSHFRAEVTTTCVHQELLSIIKHLPSVVGGVVYM